MTSTTGNTTTVEGQSLVDNGNDTATFLRTNTNWITKITPHVG
jgi:hypothetical protein